MDKDTEKRYISKVTEGLRVRLPQEIADKYRVEKNDVVEWIIEEDGNIKVEIKEMLLRGKKAKVEKVEERDVSDASGD